MSSTLAYRGHSDNIFALACSPNSQYLASASRDKTVQIWSPLSGETHLVYRGHSSCLLSVAWSPTPLAMSAPLPRSAPFARSAPTYAPNPSDGEYIASGDTNGIVQIWEAHTGKHILSYHGHTRFVRSIAWSPTPLAMSAPLPPDGEYIASGGDYRDSTVQVWQAFTGTHVYTHTNQYRIFAVSWSPNGEHVASASFDGTVQVWTALLPDTVVGLVGSEIGPKNLYTYRGHIGPVYATAWSPDGQYIASAGHDSTVHVWHAGGTQYSRGERLHIYRGHTLPVKTLAWSPDSQYIASGGNDKTLHIWESTTGRLVVTCTEHANWIRTIVWSPDGNYIASASDHQVRVFTPFHVEDEIE